MFPCPVRCRGFSSSLILVIKLLLLACGARRRTLSFAPPRDSLPPGPPSGRIIGQGAIRLSRYPCRARITPARRFARPAGGREWRNW